MLCLGLLAPFQPITDQEPHRSCRLSGFHGGLQGVSPLPVTVQPARTIIRDRLSNGAEMTHRADAQMPDKTHY